MKKEYVANIIWVILSVILFWGIYIVNDSLTEIKQRGFKNMIKDELKELEPYWNCTDK